MNLRATSRRIGDVVVLSLDGIVDLSTVPTLQSELARLVSRHPGELVLVDLDGPLAIDDAALGLLLGAAATARATGGDLEVVATEPRIRARLSATRFELAVAVRDAIV